MSREAGHMPAKNKATKKAHRPPALSRRLPSSCTPEPRDSVFRLQGNDFFFSSRRRHTRFDCDWSSDVCSSDLVSFRSAPLVSRTSPSSAAEYSSSNSPMALPLFPERASLQSYSPSRRESRPSARALFVRLAQELDESAHGRRQRLLPAVDGPPPPGQPRDS